MEYSWLLLFFALASLFLFPVRQYSRRKLPPGPWGLPIIGHLHMLGHLPHRNLHRLAKKYGPIMFIRLGLVPTIVVSSPEAAELFLKTHDTIFASRPKVLAAEYVWYGQKNLVLAQYGPYWRNIRKFCIQELLSSSKIEMFKPMRRKELLNFVECIKDASALQSSVDITAMVKSLVEDMTYEMVFGSKDDKFNIKENVREAVEFTGAFNIADYIPFLGVLDLQGTCRRMKIVSKLLDDSLTKIIDEHLQYASNGHKRCMDFIDAMLLLMNSNDKEDLHIDVDNIKSVSLDILVASMDTTSTAIEWVIAELLKHPHIMKLVQEELQNIVGLDRLVEETDLSKLKYLNMVIKESMRIHPIAPLLLPHLSTEDVTINGLFIPKNTTILINSWAIGRNSKIWSNNTEEFYPERFLTCNVDVQGHDFEFLPFGTGRRKCPGLQLGMRVVQIVVAQLVHSFNLDLLDGMSHDDLEMTEKFGLTLPRMNHVVAFPSYRLSVLC